MNGIPGGLSAVYEVKEYQFTKTYNPAGTYHGYYLISLPCDRFLAGGSSLDRVCPTTREDAKYKTNYWGTD